MQGIKKKKNNKSEEEFHDEWALSVKPSEIDVIKQFEGITSPEYKRAIELLGPIKDKYILNLGCGLGEEAVYLAIKGANVMAIDISQKMLDMTKKLAKRYRVQKRIKYHKVSAEKLDFKTNNFDFVLGCNILHHVDITKSIKEVKRVLKPNGVAVFSEPLTYNPIINVYRVIANKVRTDHEHPLSNDNLKLVSKYFPKTEHEEFHFTTLLIFLWFYFVKRYNPNKIRYWKKIISDADKYKLSFKVLYWLDNEILWTFPFLRKYCWVTVIKSIK